MTREKCPACRGPGLMQYAWRLGRRLSVRLSRAGEMPGFGHRKNMARSPASRSTMTSGTGPDRAKRPPYRYGLITVLLNEPPWQPALAKPARATETPHTFTGTLTGAFTLLPDRADSTPAFPLPLGPSANAALAGSTNPAVSTAVPIAAEIQRAFFIVLLLFRLAAG